MRLVEYGYHIKLFYANDYKIFSFARPVPAEKLRFLCGVTPGTMIKDGVSYKLVPFHLYRNDLFLDSFDLRVPDEGAIYICGRDSQAFFQKYSIIAPFDDDIRHNVLAVIEAMNYPQFKDFKRDFRDYVWKTSGMKITTHKVLDRHPNDYFMKNATLAKFKVKPIYPKISMWERLVGWLRGLV